MHGQKHLSEIAKWENFDSLTEVKKRELVNLVSKLLKENKIALSRNGPNLDKQRERIDRVVLHHTGFDVRSLDFLSALGLIRLYASEYKSKEAIWSGHFKKKRQVFWGYHFLILKNGKILRLLGDNQIGWHAGNWKINCKSIGIALSGDFVKSYPSSKQLASLKKLLKKYGNIKIVGHFDVVDTICPGGWFEKWKKTESGLTMN